jgi:hypothetical protein
MAEATSTYSQNARPVGFPATYRIEGDTLVVDTLRKVDTVDLRQVREVRLTYEPKTFAQRVFRLTMRLEGGRTVTFSSISWASMVEARRQDGPYRAFVLALIAAVARAAPGARFVGGRTPPAWIGLTILAFGTLVAIALFAWRAWQAGATGAVLMALVLAAVGFWQLEPMVRLNKPRRFSADQPPADLLP